MKMKTNTENWSTPELKAITKELQILEKDALSLKETGGNGKAWRGITARIAKVKRNLSKEIGR